MNGNLFDKRSAFQVIAGVMHNPEFIDEYDITESDFDCSTFHAIVFSAIYNLHNQGVNKIETFTIDSYLSNYDAQYRIFIDGRGIDFCTQVSEMWEMENFPYYVGKLKKFSFLRYIESQGFDVKKIYDWEADETNQEKEMAKLDALSINEIVEKLEVNLIINSKLRFCTSEKNHGQLAGLGLKDLVENLEETPEAGLPMQSSVLTMVSRGMRLKKVYVRSASSGSGKSRLALADFAHISIPWYYNTEMDEWMYTGLNEPVLFISTELEMDEVQTIVLAYVSGVQEDHILRGQYIGNERERISKAIQYIESSSLYIEFLPNFSMQDVETIIKKYHRTYGVSHICFDYVHMSAKLISEIASGTHGMKLREDQILFLFVDQLKNLCNTLGVFLLTMTQLNGEYKNSSIKDETLLRGSKAMADRIDMGEITLPPSSTELDSIKSIMSHLVNKPTPNMIHHIYKLRRGKLSKIRIWQYVDLGTCRSVDLFVTNNDNELLNINVEEMEEASHVDEIIEQESVPLSEIITDPEENELVHAVTYNLGF